LEYKYAPIKLNGYKLIIANTNKRRGLADSKYNERRGQCEQAVEDLKKELNITCLGDIDVKTFEEHKHLIKDPVVANRAAHVVYEDERVKDAVCDARKI
jgi:galactokinase